MSLSRQPIGIQQTIYNYLNVAAKIKLLKTDFNIIYHDFQMETITILSNINDLHNTNYYISTEKYYLLSAESLICAKCRFIFDKSTSIKCNECLKYTCGCIYSPDEFECCKKCDKFICKYCKYKCISCEILLDCCEDKTIVICQKCRTREYCCTKCNIDKCSKCEGWTCKECNMQNICIQCNNTINCCDTKYKKKCKKCKKKHIFCDKCTVDKCIYCDTWLCNKCTNICVYCDNKIKCCDAIYKKCCNTCPIKIIICYNCIDQCDSCDRCDTWSCEQCIEKFELCDLCEKKSCCNISVFSCVKCNYKYDICIECRNDEIYCADCDEELKVCINIDWD